VEGEVEVCWVLCIPEQQGRGRYLLCLVGKTGNGGREEGKKEGEAVHYSQIVHLS